MHSIKYLSQFRSCCFSPFHTLTIQPIVPSHLFLILKLHKVSSQAPLLSTGIPPIVSLIILQLFAGSGNMSTTCALEIISKLYIRIMNFPGLKHFSSLISMFFFYRLYPCYRHFHCISLTLIRIWYNLHSQSR